MVSKRELACERARTQRALVLQREQRAAELRQAKLDRLLDCIRQILAHDDFAQLALSHGVKSVPKCLVSGFNTAESSEVITRSTVIAQQTTAFIVAWKFMSSILQDQEIRDFIADRWPDFISEIKDVFIGIATNGPFPEERKRTLPSARQAH